MKRTFGVGYCKEIQPVHLKGDQSWKDWCWSWNSSTLAISWEELTNWKRHWSWEGLGAGGEGGDDRGWDGLLSSPTRWTWVWVDSGSWWWTGRPGVLQFMGLQRVGHDWVRLNWTPSLHSVHLFLICPTSIYWAPGTRNTKMTNIHPSLEVLTVVSRWLENQGWWERKGKVSEVPSRSSFVIAKWYTPVHVCVHVCAVMCSSSYSNQGRKKKVMIKKLGEGYSWKGLRIYVTH